MIYCVFAICILDFKLPYRVKYAEHWVYMRKDLCRSVSIAEKDAMVKG